jgi:hypothetical protein
MSDDIPRSAHGNRPPQRRGNSAPTWWAALERDDLVDECGLTDEDMELHGPLLGGEEREAEDQDSSPVRAWSRRRSWLVYLVVAAAAMILILIGVGASSTHTVLAALLVIAAPLGLAALAAAAVVRRSGS